MSYSLTWQEQGAIQRFWGTMSDDDLENCNNHLFGNYRFDDIKYLIVDCQAVEESRLSDSLILEIAHIDNAATTYKRRLKVAFVCRLPSLLEQIQSYISITQSIGSTWEFVIHSDLEPAEIWANSRTGNTGPSIPL